MEKNKKLITTIIILVVLVVLVFTLGNRMFEYVDAGEIVIIQDPIDGDLHVKVAPGLYWRNFGTSEHYKKEEQYWFSSDEAEGEVDDQSITIRFNDGGSGAISGSIRWKMPMDETHLIELHSVYGSQNAIEHNLIRTVVTKAVYMTGPLMSSKESYAERRSEIIFFIEDQAKLGVYRTRSFDEKIIDSLTHVEKKVKKVEILKDDNGAYKRQELSPLAKHGIQLYNLSINKVSYNEAILKQIEAQRKAIMDIQTSMAETKKAEQNALKVEQEGIANAAQAKWEQEVLKARAVTEAEQKMEVASFNMKAAEFYKKEQILRGEGEAKYKQLVMQADGALEQKLKVYENVSRMYADAIKGYQGSWVPSIVMGGGSSGSSNGANALVDLLMVKTAKDLSLDLTVGK